MAFCWMEEVSITHNKTASFGAFDMWSQLRQEQGSLLPPVCRNWKTARNCWWKWPWKLEDPRVKNVCCLLSAEPWLYWFELLPLLGCIVDHPQWMEALFGSLVAKAEANQGKAELLLACTNSQPNATVFTSPCCTSKLSMWSAFCRVSPWCCQTTNRAMCLMFFSTLFNQDVSEMFLAAASILRHQPMSSKPFSRQFLRKASTSKGMALVKPRQWS